MVLIVKKVIMMVNNWNEKELKEKKTKLKKKRNKKGLGPRKNFSIFKGHLHLKTFSWTNFSFVFQSRVLKSPFYLFA